jgi:purine-binding chemotaxis protein CheW
MKTDRQDSTMQFVTFRLHGRTYGIPISCVREINKSSSLTRVPNTEEFVEGVMNLRGSVIPVINVRKRFRLAPDGAEKRRGKLIIIEFDEAPVGLIVDDIAEVVRISASSIESDREKMAEIGTEYVEGLGKTDDGILPILDVNKLIGKERKDHAAV